MPCPCHRTSRKVLGVAPLLRSLSVLIGGTCAQEFRRTRAAAAAQPVQSEGARLLLHALCAWTRNAVVWEVDRCSARLAQGRSSKCLACRCVRVRSVRCPASSGQVVHTIVEVVPPPNNSSAQPLRPLDGRQPTFESPAASRLVPHPPFACTR